jgi:hypothetical protein
MDVALACAGVALPLPVRQLFSFPTKHKVKYTFEPCAEVIVKLTHAIARVVEGIKIRVGRRATFAAGIAAPFLIELWRLRL